MPWVSLKDLHEQTGLAVRTLQYVGTKEPGVLVTRVTKKGKSTVTEYKQPDCAINLRNRETKKQEEKPSTETQARTRKLLAEAAQEEMKLARLRGQLLTVEDFEGVLVRVFEVVRPRAMTWPGRFATQLVDMPSPAAVQGVLDAAVRELLKDMQEAMHRIDWQLARSG